MNPSERSLRLQIIKDINKSLLSHGKNSLSSNDFDVLWDLDIDDLIKAQIEIEEAFQSLVSK